MGEQLPRFGSKPSGKRGSEVERNAAATKLESIANFTPGLSHVAIIVTDLTRYRRAPIL